MEFDSKGYFEQFLKDNLTMDNSHEIYEVFYSLEDGEEILFKSCCNILGIDRDEFLANFDGTEIFDVDEDVGLTAIAAAERFGTIEYENPNEPTYGTIKEMLLDNSNMEYIKFRQQLYYSAACDIVQNYNESDHHFTRALTIIEKMGVFRDKKYNPVLSNDRPNDEEIVTSQQSDAHDSIKQNIACADAIDKAIIESNYEPYRYDLETAVQKVLSEYGADRVTWALADAVQVQFDDDRYSLINKKWAESFYIPHENSRGFYSRTDPAVLDKFIDFARIAIEAERITVELRELAARWENPNSPDKKHFMVKVSDYFAESAPAWEQKKLTAAIPFKKASLHSHMDYSGVYMWVPANEIKRELKKAPPSVPAQHQHGLSVAAKSEKDFFYSMSEECDGETGCIGHLRADFGRSGKEFFTSWDDHRPELKTQAFKDEFDNVIKTLRKDILKSLSDMTSYCDKHPDAKLDDGRGYNYGFKLKTPNHVYYLRCGVVKNDNNLYCYAYERSRIEKYLSVSEQQDEKKPVNQEKPSILTQLQDKKNAVVQDADSRKTKPKRNSSMEV